MKRALVSAAIGGAMLFGTAPAAGAALLPNVAANNLVNVQVSGVNVQVPIGVAANVCDVSVAVLAELDDDAAACTADSTQLPRAFR